MATSRLLVFGDASIMPLCAIQRIFTECALRQSESLRSFIRKATDAIQIEVSKLQPHERASFGAFDSFLELAELYDKKEDTLGIVHAVLVCLIRLGELILYSEEDHSILDCHGDSKVHALAICNGLLPATAASIANNLEELSQAGILILVITCRLAANVSRRSKEIEDSSKESWAFSVLGADAPRDIHHILDQFHQSQSIPEHRQAYVGISGQNWVTVFGPPSVLRELRASPQLLNADIVATPAYGAVHASHLRLPDFDRIIGSSPLLNRRIKDRFNLISVPSTHTDKRTIWTDMRGLLEHKVLPDILTNFIDVSALFKSAVSCFPKGTNVELRAMGPTSHLSPLKRYLKMQGVSMAEVNPVSTPSKPCEMLRAGSDHIAIVGMAGRFPGSETVEELWESLMHRKSFVREIPKERFDVEAYFDPTGKAKNSMTTKSGCFLEHPGEFDNWFFNISPREALQMDPTQRLFLMAAYEALESAGYAPNNGLATQTARMGTFFGHGGDDWRDIIQTQGVDIYYAPGNVRAFAPARVNHHFKWEGPTYSFDSACASSSSAIGSAMSALRDRECDTAVAGGGNIIASPFWNSTLSKAGFLTGTPGGCKTFREDADGYCRAEAVGVVVLKRLEDAIHDNDSIIAVLRSYARNHSANAVSLTRPDAGAQKKLYSQVLHRAALQEKDITYVEMHGTGTVAGDSVEMQSLVDVFGKGRTETSPLLVSSLKANIGHSEAASGVSSLIKAAMIAQRGLIPPQIGIPERLNNNFRSLKDMHIHIANQQHSTLPRVSGSKTAVNILVNNFDAAGGNSCFVVEQAPSRPEKDCDPRTYHTVVLSAHSNKSLQVNKRRLLRFLLQNPDTKLADLAYSTTARRIHHKLRVAFSSKDTEGLIAQLRESLDSKESIQPVQQPLSSHPAVIFLFTGQGSQYAGMGNELWRTCPRFKESLLKYQVICDGFGFPKFRHMITQDIDTSSVTLDTVSMQLAHVALELAVADLWRSWGVEPSLVLGHSLGEYSALCVSGVLSVSDTLYLVGKRAMLLKTQCTEKAYAMLAVGQSSDFVTGILQEMKLTNCDISCINGPMATVISGPMSDIHTLQESLERQQLRSRKLDTPYGFHSRQIEPILDEFQQGAMGISFAKPSIPVMSSLTGAVINAAGTFSPDYLARQAREPVNFVQALESCFSKGYATSQTVWVEVGPDPTCLGLVRSNHTVPAASHLPSMKSGESNWKTLSTSIAMAYASTLDIDWHQFHRDHQHCLTHLQLPHYAFDLKNFWITYDVDTLLEGRQTKEPKPNSLGSSESMMRFSTCLHKIVDEPLQQSSLSTSFLSYLSEPTLLEVIDGHKVLDISLCPAAVFCDMALTAVIYMHTKYLSYTAARPHLAMSISKLNLQHPAVPSRQDPLKAIRVAASKTNDTSRVFDVDFALETRDCASQNLGGCQIHIDDAEWSSEWNKMAYFVSLRIATIAELAKGGCDGAHWLKGSVVYKLFANLVTYSEHYQGIQDAYITRDFSEGVATVRLGSNNPANQFTLSPYWIDTLMHLSGFLLNGNPVDSSDLAYIASGFERLQIYTERLKPNETYMIYVRLRPIPPSTESKSSTSRIVDVFIFKGDEQIGMCDGINYQALPKSVFSHILGKANGHHISTQAREVMAHCDRNPVQQSSSNDKLFQSLSEHSTQANTLTPTSSCNTPLPETQRNPTNTDIIEIFISKVLSETQMDREHLTETTSFADIGVDSLLSIAILKEIVIKTGLELEASFFILHPTLADARQALAKIIGQSDAGHLPTDVAYPSGIPRMSSDVANGLSLPSEITERFTSNVVLVQGTTSPGKAPLFLICDGTGSAASYVNLPRFPTELQVFALESPFLHKPTDFTCSVSQVAAMYLKAIRTKQTHGPYMLGGWSAGAVYAYEVARLLLNSGEKILGLLLIDMRGPRHVEHCQEPTMETLSRVGLLTGIDRTFTADRATTTGMKEHLLATVKCLSKFNPIAMDVRRRPEKTFLIWATEQLEAQESHEVSLDIPWFYPSTHAFDADGWDELVGQVECRLLATDHFLMMTPPAVNSLGQLLQEAIAQFQ